MGRQVQKGWRGTLLAYLAQSSRAATAVAFAGLLFDLGTTVAAVVAWGIGRPSGAPLAGLVALGVSAALCVIAIYVRPRRLKEWLAAVGAALALVAPWMFWPSIGPPG